MGDPIDVSFAARRIAGVKIIARDAGEQDANVARQISVDGAAKFVRRDLPLELHAGDLSFGMNTGIGTSRTVHYHFASVQQ